MRRLLAAFLLAACPLFGQATVDSSQVKTKTNGGIAGDTTNALTAIVYRNTSAPSSPNTGALWCDTSFSPCILKQYSGTEWTAPLVSPAISTQANISSFPGSPVDGQVFMSKSPRTVWVYDSTATAWWPLQHDFLSTPGPFTDVYPNTVITPPASAPTAATSGTAGSTPAGTFSYRVTFYNSTGGETTPGPISNSVAPGVSKSNDLSSIPTGGTGTVGRRIYRSKANGNVYGPWYWTANIADNSTTTYHDGAADTANVLIVPDVNFSGPLPTGWAVLDTLGGIASGGCGTTARSSMVCMSSNAMILCPGSGCAGQGNGSTTNDNALRASRDLSAYQGFSYTLSWRIKHIGLTGDVSIQVTNPALWGMRSGTSDWQRFFRIDAGAGGGSCGTTNVTLPWTSSNRPALFYLQRATFAGAITCGGTANAYPQIEKEPIYWKLFQRVFGGPLTQGSNSSGTVSVGATFMAAAMSPDGVTWTDTAIGTGASNATANQSYNTAFYPLDHFEINPWSYPGSQQQAFIEIDGFSLTIP